RDEHDPRAGRVDREGPALVGEVALVVVAIPGGVLADACAERLPQIRGATGGGVEVRNQRLVLRVDQVIWARGADLAHLRRASRRGERDRLGAAVDLEHDSGGAVEQGAAERGEGRLEEGSRAHLPE